MPDELGRSLRARAVPLATLAPQDDHEDLRPLREVLGRRRVVGLGEATHGTRELFTLKHRLIAFMVTDLGSRVVAMEASESAATAVDAYVRHGRGRAQDALAGLGFWTWNTREVLALLHWLRAHNGEVGPDRAVRFVGVDPQVPAVAVDAVTAALGDDAPERLAEVAGALAALRALNLGDPPTDPAVVAPLERLDARVAPEHVTRLRRSARLAVASRARADPGSVFAVRDRLMAEGVLAAAHEAPTGGPVAFWAHNGHVRAAAAGTPRPVGAHLREHLGADYYALGLLVGSGSFRAFHRRWPGRPRRLRAVPVGPPPSTTVEGQVLAACPGDVVIDLRDGAAPPAVAAWRAAPSWTRSFGAVAPAFPDTAATAIVPGEEFDGLAVVRHGHPSAPVVGEGPDPDG